MRTLIFTAFILLYSVQILPQLDSSLILSEIMFNAQSGNNEFIEIYNLSDVQSIDLSGYKIKYYNSSPDVIKAATDTTIIPPNGYAVIFEGDYDFISGIYNNLIPPSAVKLKISDNAFGSTGMSNENSRPLLLLTPSNDTIDSYIYSVPNSSSISDEKIILNRDTTSSNWGNSEYLKGTPGSRNSISPINFDLIADSLTCSPQIPYLGSHVELTAKIRNKGLLSADEYLVNFYNDIDLDSIPEPGELLNSIQYYNLSPGDSISAIINYLPLNEGIHSIVVFISFMPDEDTLNNSTSVQFMVYPPGYSYNSIVINEIMYAPSSDEPEWIELLNRSPNAVDLCKWKIGDNSSSITLPNNSIQLLPDEFIIISDDSSLLNYYNINCKLLVVSLPSLNNTEDGVILKDSSLFLIDSLHYLPSWGGNSRGRSLERIDKNVSSLIQENWGSSLSVFKATPGYKNSITPKYIDISFSSFKSFLPYAVIGEKTILKAVLKNQGTGTINNFSLYFYNDVNKDSIPQSSELRFTYNGSSILPSDSVELEYQTSEISQGDNYFIAAAETEGDEDTTNNIAFTSFIGITAGVQRDDLVINEIMYSPESPQPEWLEIFNRGTKKINLKNFYAGENSDTVKIIKTDCLLFPKEYLVIAKDSSLLNYHNVNSKFITANLPALNNTGDKVIIMDSLYRIIDSLEYFPQWGKSGRSIERISTEESSIDSANWYVSINKYKATPGYINSVSKKDNDVELTGIIINPLYPLKGDNVNITYSVKNNGRNNSVFEIQLYEDTNLDSIPDILITSWPGQTIAANDSAVLNINYLIQNLQKPRGFTAYAVFPNDEDTSNNYSYKRVSPGYPPGSIVINEISFSPAGGEPEWIELYNGSVNNISLKEWVIGDASGYSPEINEDFIINADSYIVITKDSAINDYHRTIPSEIIVLPIPAFNNDKDAVVLKDDRGETIDSVYYFDDWGIMGHSLERVSINFPSNINTNWGECKDIEYSTPGRINSRTVKQKDLSVSGIYFNPRFPKAGDKVQISTVIKNNGTSPVENFSLDFYLDTDSNNVMDLTLNSYSSLTLQPGDSLGISAANLINNINGKYLCAVRIFYPADEDTFNNYYERSVEPGYQPKSVLLNEVMYSPEINEPEWIELINCSADTINMFNWSFSDLLTTPERAYFLGQYKFPPSEYLIITRDSSFLLKYPSLINKTLILPFGSLGSSSDGIIIYDFRDAVIDSLFYRSSWGGKNGYSLERISLDKATCDSSNWISSLSTGKSTPGIKNSIDDIPLCNRGDIIINEIMSDPDIDNSEYIEFYNCSSDSINIGGWRFEDAGGNYYRLADTRCWLSSSCFYVAAADSIIFEKYSLKDIKITIFNSSSLMLTKAGELVLLKDARGNIIDSVYYLDKWHNKNLVSTKNISLERVNPYINANAQSSWSSCADPLGGTPGKQNSIYGENKNTTANISVSPNPFSPDNDGFEDNTIINFNLPFSSAQVSIKIFDNRGRTVRDLLNNEISSSRGSVIFNGLGDDGLPLRIGIYIIYLEAADNLSSKKEVMKAVVVAARKL